MTEPVGATVGSLHRYPVKSMLGEDLASCELTATGLVGDRGYALVDSADGTVASAKHPRKWSGLLAWSARYLAEPVVGQPLPPVQLTAPDGTVLRSDDPGADRALSAALGRDVRLSAQPVAGALFEEVWPEIEGLAPDDFITSTTTGRSESDEALSALALGLLVTEPSFMDLSALHLLTTATLAELSRLTPGSSFDARRYRPNILVAGPDLPADAEPGFAEDAWVGAEVGLGGAAVRVTMLTMRCVMTTLAQGPRAARPQAQGPRADSGLAEDRDTLRTLARHHRRDIPGLGTWACAGVYADVTRPGTVRVGDHLLLPGAA